MFKKILLLSALLTGALLAQNLTVSGTVLNADGTPLAGGIITSTLTNSAGLTYDQLPYNAQTANIPVQNASAVLDSSGSFSLGVKSNAQVTGSYWKFVVCSPTANTQCASIIQQITSNTDISTNLSNALAAVLNPSGKATVAYVNNSTSSAGLNSILFDNFDRANSVGPGSAPTGQAYTITGPGSAFAQIVNNQYTTVGSTTGVTYTGYLSSTLPSGIGATISWNQTTVDQFTLILSADPVINLHNMLHLGISSTGVTMGYFFNGGSLTFPTCSGSLNFATPLSQDGTQYTFRMFYSGNTVYISGPNGYSNTCSDSHISQVAGNLGIWEFGASDNAQVFNSFQLFSSAKIGLFGSLSSLGGYTGSVGYGSPQGGWFSAISTSPTLPPDSQNPLIVENSTNGTLGQFIQDSAANAKVIIKATQAGFTPILFFTSSSGTAPFIESEPNANNLSFWTGGGLRFNINITTLRPTVPTTGSWDCTHGTNARCGTVTLTAGSAVIPTTQATAFAAVGGAGNVYRLDCANNPATPTTTACATQPYVSAITPGTSFTITGTGTDTVFWHIEGII